MEPQMSPFPYDALWHYSQKFSRDADLRQDLVLLAWQMDKKLAERSDIRLLKHLMKLRSREIHKRNSLGKEIGGKSAKDFYTRERLSIHKPLPEGSLWPIADTLSCVAYDPLSTTIVNQFSDSLPEMEGRVAEQMIAGYSQQESADRLGISTESVRQLRSRVKEKAREYLA
jgi:hypothetical protein